MKTIAIILALLCVSAFSFKIRQGPAGFGAAATDAQAGLQALGAATTDSVALVQDSLAAGTQFFNQAVGTLTAGFGGMMGGGARLQQGNEGFAHSLTDAQAAWGSVADAINEGIQSLTDVVDGATVLADQGIETLAAAGGAAPARLQQGGLGQVLGDVNHVNGDVAVATEDFLNSFDEALDGLSALTQQTLSGLAGAAGAGRR